MMTNFLPDEIVLDILDRLPAKPLLRCRCLSTYWNRLISEPSFMKSRARRSAILYIGNAFCLIETNVPTDDTSNSIQKQPDLVENFVKKNFHVMIAGTFNGIVLLVHTDIFILYNPFTGSFTRLPSLRSWTPHNSAYGFGYGATPDDLKIVRVRQYFGISEIYCFKQGTWISRSLQTTNINIKFADIVGTFLNGFLYWVTFGRDTITVINVKDMVLSEMHLPFTKSQCHCFMGTMHGCLCLLTNNFQGTRYDTWVMKEHGDEKSWSNTHSFTLSLQRPSMDEFMSTSHIPVCILENGRILMCNPSEQLIIYDTSNDSYEIINFSSNKLLFSGLRGMEYVESFLSPSDLCLSTLKTSKRKRHDQKK